MLPPLGTIAIRAAAGSEDPWSIWMPTLFATVCSTTVAVVTYFGLSGLPFFRHRPELPGSVDAASLAGAEEENAATPDDPPLERPGVVWRLIAVGLGVAFLVFLAIEFVSGVQTDGVGGAVRAILREWTLPLLILGFLLAGALRGVPAYDAMIEGGREALGVASRIVPFLVAILVAVAMFRASGALDVLVGLIDPWTSRIGVPAEVLPMALMRPLSGSGAFGLMSEIVEAHGPDSFIGLLTTTLMGSTETTFYVLAVYLGAAGVVDGRHALFACLAGDAAGFAGAVAACHYFFA